MAHYEPSHQDLHCLSSFNDFELKNLLTTKDMTKYKDGRVHFRNSRVKGLGLKKSVLLPVDVFNPLFTE